jgi:hypothetical protein
MLYRALTVWLAIAAVLMTAPLPSSAQTRARTQTDAQTQQQQEDLDDTHGSAPRDSILLVIGSPGSILNSVRESLIARQLKNLFSPYYRNVYIWRESSNQLPEAALVRIATERNGGERLDIFSLQRGPDVSFIPGIAAANVEALLPKGFVRRVYSSGYQQWGVIALDARSSRRRVISTTAFGSHLERLGADEYLIFANGTSPWKRSLLQLAPLIAGAHSWSHAALPYLQKIDQALTAKVGELKPNVPIIRPVIAVREPQDPLNPDALSEAMAMGFPLLERREVGTMNEVLLGFQPALAQALSLKSTATLKSK